VSHARPLAADRVAALVTCHVEPPDPAFLAAVRERVGHVLVVDDGMPRPRGVALDRDVAAIGGEVLHLGENRGKGHALAAGLAILVARAEPVEAVVVLDGDGQHRAEWIPSLVEAGQGADLVIGDRSAEHARVPLERRLANRMHAAVMSAMTGHRVPDSQCGMRLLSGRALRGEPFPPGRYESETLHLKRCLDRGVSVTWVPIPAVYEDEVSSFRRMRDSLRVTMALFS